VCGSRAVITVPRFTPGSQRAPAMSTVLDLYIQDFVTTNRLLGQHVPWSRFVSRRFAEGGAAIKVVAFQSDGSEHFATLQHLELPTGDCLRVELTHAAARDAGEHRFDCLRMTHSTTHTGLEFQRATEDTVIITLATRNQGLIPVMFVVRDGLPLGRAEFV
jgi:hypothetical protein